MGTYHDATWESDTSGYSRRERMGGTYRWYLPTPLANLDVSLDGDVVADVSRAERAVFRPTSSDARGMEGIARLLLRSEAVASSRIEGLSIGAGRLVRAELQEREPGSVRYDRRAAQVLGNVRAMDEAIAHASEPGPITLDTILDIHRALVAHTDEESFGGEIRDVQNWIGGGSFSPMGATYVPPAPSEVPRLLEDIVAFLNRDDLSPVVQAALVHSQFESVHPFVDGNGRTGRALVQVVLMRAGVARESMPPVSLALATERTDYLDSLGRMQRWVTPEEGHAAINDWVSTFAGATLKACKDRERMSSELEAMRASWARKLGGQPRRGSALEAVLPGIQAMPWFTIRTLEGATGFSFKAVNDAVSTLVGAGIVQKTTKGKRNRVFVAPDVIEEFQMVERRMASPARDTHAVAPARPVPAGRPRQHGEEPDYLDDAAPKPAQDGSPLADVDDMNLGGGSNDGGPDRP